MPERQYEVVDNTADIEAILTKIDEKGFTANQEHFGNWIGEKAAPNFGTGKETNAFILGAKYALALRMEHQKSPENHAAKEKSRTERADEVAAKPKRVAKADATETVPAAPAKRGRRAAAAPVEEAPAAPAARRGRRTAAAATPAATAEAPAKPGRRRPAAAGARRGANKAEADF